MTKISKILLPISGLALATTAVTPLVGCSKKDEWDKAVDLINFRPDPATVHPITSMTADQATEALFGDKNAMFLVEQDIYNYLSWQLRYEFDWAKIWFGLDWVGAAKEADCLLSGVKLEYNATQKRAYLSGTIRLRAECELINPSMRTERWGTYTLETKHVITKMPYTMTYTGWEGYSYWTSYFSDEMLTGDTNWSVYLEYAGKAVYENIEHEDEEESNNATYNHEDYDYDTLSLIRWWSYYLYKVTKA